MRENVREKGRQVDEALREYGLMGRVERLCATDVAKEVINSEFEANLQAMQEKVKDLPKCYAFCIKQLHDAKRGEKEEYIATVWTTFRFNLYTSIKCLAAFMPVDDVLVTLADESQNEELWLESLRTACQTISAYVMADFCEKLLAMGMPASESKDDLRKFVFQMTGKTLTDDELNQLWMQEVVIFAMAGIFR